MMETKSSVVWPKICNYQTSEIAFRRQIILVFTFLSLLTFSFKSNAQFSKGTTRFDFFTGVKPTVYASNETKNLVSETIRNQHINFRKTVSRSFAIGLFSNLQSRDIKGYFVENNYFGVYDTTYRSQKFTSLTTCVSLELNLYSSDYISITSIALPGFSLLPAESIPDSRFKDKPVFEKTNFAEDVKIFGSFSISPICFYIYPFKHCGVGFFYFVGNVSGFSTSLHFSM